MSPKGRHSTGTKGKAKASAVAPAAPSVRRVRSRSRTNAMAERDSTDTSDLLGPSSSEESPWGPPRRLRGPCAGPAGLPTPRPVRYDPLEGDEVSGPTTPMPSLPPPPSSASHAPAVHRPEGPPAPTPAFPVTTTGAAMSACPGSLPMSSASVPPKLGYPPANPWSSSTLAPHAIPSVGEMFAGFQLHISGWTVTFSPTSAGPLTPNMALATAKAKGPPPANPANPSEGNHPAEATVVAGGKK